MKDLVVWFEIPVNDFSRAKQFYNKLLQTKIEAEEIAGTVMGFFQLRNYSNSGAIVQCPGYEPGDKGPLLYFNAGEDLRSMLKRAEIAGAEILQPRTLISEAIGYYAVFRDTEGNRIALHSKG